jgi:hypothetical protein
MIRKILPHLFGRSTPPAPAHTISAPFPAAGTAMLEDESRRAKLAALARRAQSAGRLAFVIDNTASRFLMWRKVQEIQRRMVHETRQFGRLSLRVIHFGGNEVSAYPEMWTESADEIAAYMDGISCCVGGTMIVPAIDRLLNSEPLPSAIVLIGDSCEESFEQVRACARNLGRQSIPVFSFFDTVGWPTSWRDGLMHQPTDTQAEGLWILARESGGAFALFGDKLDLSSLMIGTAAYVAGGAPALLSVAERPNKEGEAASQFIEQLRLQPPSGK